MKNTNWEEFNTLSQQEKAPFFNQNDQIYDCLISQQFTLEFLDTIYALTNKIRKISKTPDGARFLKKLLANKRAMLYFIQPSTRTYLSFVTACQNLGIETADVRNSDTSSEVKGESFDDTIRTFSSYFDVIIMRCPGEKMAQRSAWVLNNSERPIPVINAGSGKDQHPTQALLDIYTLRRSFEKVGGIDNKTIILAGDLLRGRTVRSLAYLLASFQNITLIFSSPEKFKMKGEIIEWLNVKENITIIETEEFHKYLPKADAIYMTRIQDEHDNKEFQSKKSYPEFSLKAKDLSLLKEHAIIMHPLPRREEIDPKIDTDPRAVYWRQERNGMWTRTALLAMIFKADKKINLYWQDLSDTFSDDEN